MIKECVEIEELFECSADIINNRENEAKLIQNELKSHNIVIYGCGNCGVTLYAKLHASGYIVKGFIDQNSMYGDEYAGVPIVAPEKWAERFGDNVLIIIATYNIQIYSDIIHNIEEFSNEKKYLLYIVLDLRDIDEIINNENGGHFSVYLGENIGELIGNKERIISTYYALRDEESRKCYLELIKFYMSEQCLLDFSILPFDDHYFAYDLYDRIDEEVFIDCGAFIGDTYDIFIKKNCDMFREYIAIEADKLNCEKLKKKTDRIKIINKFISSDVHDIFFENTGTSYGQAIKHSFTSIKTDTLDNLVYEFTPSFIKVNVEGAEMEVLEGAKRIVSDFKPILALQGHHKMSDLWEIVEFFVKYNYEGIYLRNYHGIDEFTFYAIPQNRKVIND